MLPGVSIIQLLKRWWRAAIAAALLLALGVQTWRLDRSHAALDRAQAANAAQVAEYRQAAEQVRADAEKRRADEMAEQQRITKNVTTDYEGTIADLRARYDRLRIEAASADSRRAGTCNLPGISDATGQPDAATLNNRFLAILEAADINTERLIALQAWVRGQQSLGH